MITPSNDGIYLDLQVQPKARRPGARGVYGERLRLAVAEPPEGGRANEAIIAAIAGLLLVPARSVTLVSGATSRRKRVHISGIDPEVARGLIEAAIPRLS